MRLKREKRVRKGRRKMVKKKRNEGLGNKVKIKKIFIDVVVAML